MLAVKLERDDAIILKTQQGDAVIRINDKSGLAFVKLIIDAPPDIAVHRQNYKPKLLKP